MQKLHSSLENVVRSVVIVRNELNLATNLPPETLINIFELVAEPRTRESMFEIVKMTHVCQYWRSTLISCPHLWSSVFVKSDHKDFVTACLERSREVPLAVHLDLEHGDYRDNHASINPIPEVVHLKRIRTLDVHLSLLKNGEDRSDQDFQNALNNFGLFVLPLPVLESLNFRADHLFNVDTHLEFPKALFFWGSSPPTALRHLTLHGCYGGPILDVRNLTSFELAGDPEAFDPIGLDQVTFLPFLSNNPSLVSLSLSHCGFPDRSQLSQVTPIELPELKTLQLIGIYGLSSFSGLVRVPALQGLSSLRISARENHCCPDFLVHAESGDGFQLSYDANCREVAPGWLDITNGADPSPAFVRFGRWDFCGELVRGAGVSPLVLFSGARVLEISASFASHWYHDFWEDLEKVGPQLATLRLEVIEGIKPAVAGSVETLARVRFNKGMPLTTMERMTFEDMSEEDEEKAKRLWEEFRAGLNIDQYLAAQ